MGKIIEKSKGGGGRGQKASSTIVQSPLLPPSSAAPLSYILRLKFFFMLSVSDLCLSSNTINLRPSGSPAPLTLLPGWSSLFLSWIASSYLHYREMIRACKVNFDVSDSFLFLLPPISVLPTVYMHLLFMFQSLWGIPSFLVAFCAYLLETGEKAGDNFRVFSYHKLKVATDGFHPSNKIGEGGCGSVYKVGININ